jgi:hypothetical protein
LFEEGAAIEPRQMDSPVTCRPQLRHRACLRFGVARSSDGRGARHLIDTEGGFAYPAEGDCRFTARGDISGGARTSTLIDPARAALLPRLRRDQRVLEVEIVRRRLAEAHLLRARAGYPAGYSTPVPTESGFCL